MFLFNVKHHAGREHRREQCIWWQKRKSGQLLLKTNSEKSLKCTYRKRHVDCALLRKYSTCDVFHAYIRGQCIVTSHQRVFNAIFQTGFQLEPQFDW